MIIQFVEIESFNSKLYISLKTLITHTTKNHLCSKPFNAKRTRIILFILDSFIHNHLMIHFSAVSFISFMTLSLFRYISQPSQLVLVYFYHTQNSKNCRSINLEFDHTSSSTLQFGNDEFIHFYTLSLFFGDRIWFQVQWKIFGK